MTLFDAQKNREERMKFVELWAEYVRNNPDEDWSRQQKVVVDSQLKGINLKAEEYLKMKEKRR